MSLSNHVKKTTFVQGYEQMKSPQHTTQKTKKDQKTTPGKAIQNG